MYICNGPENYSYAFDVTRMWISVTRAADRDYRILGGPVSGSTTLGRAAAEFANDLAVDRTFRFFLPQYYPLCGFNSPEMMLHAYKLSHKLTLS